MYHAWAFNLKGELVGVPYQEGYGENFKREDYNLVPVQVDTFGEMVFVAVNPTIPDLREYLGEMVPHLEPYMQEIEMIGRNSWIYNGNWKLWHDNFRDNYHPEFAHRMIHDATPHYADRGGNWACAPGHSVLQWISDPPNVGSYMRALRRHSGINLSDEEIPATVASEDGAAAMHTTDVPQEVLAIFPNLDVQPGPKTGGRGMYAGYIQTLTPLTVDKTRVDIIIYSHKGEPAEDRQWALESLADSQGAWGKVSADDTEAAYRCQVGMPSLGTQFSIFTRGVDESLQGELADARDEFSSREFYRVYTQYLAAE
jgi:benzoate/toluate 1,2-dioxygenase alpha subunit